jgi:hypothetical protein
LFEAVCNIRQKLITQIYSEDSSPIEPFKEEDVSTAVKQLNAGKAADEYDSSSSSAVNNLHSAFDSEISSADSNIEQPSVKPNYNVDGLKLCDNFGSNAYSKSYTEPAWSSK